ncbi:Crp/Fnr family transcriptional regulator [Rhizobium paknamense]|uniref:CRP-like cAMP-binding protein n=1 Tax=Rhizobium paknamense TaxID=1206817 RepID=A0ABU0II53_9HYPH|nr:Crp/Fnr family transcriptional regulator [Rhizobium paknamense]MDQ0456879.1 CRP-like cAMP-binding protein [Rhizobium paknamense]
MADALSAVREPVLSRAAIFRSLSEEDDLRWSRQCLQTQVAPGTVLFDYNGEGTHVFFSLEGSLRLTVRLGDRKELFLEEFPPGQVVGDLSALDGHTYAACLMSSTEAQLLMMPQALFRQIVAERPPVCLELVTVMARRLRSLIQRMSELSYLDARHRLYNTLLRLSQPCDEQKDRRIIAPPIIHADLAEYIGASRETVSREMSRLLQDGVIERTSDAIILRQPRELLRRLSKVGLA